MKRIIYCALSLGVVVAVTTLNGCSKSSPAASQQTVSELDAKNLHQQATQFQQKAQAEQGSNPTQAAADQKQATQLNAMSADELARIGELLLMPEGMTYANQMFDQALAIDPKNNKANFYKAWTGPLMTLQGYIPMVQPLLVNQGDQDGLERIREHLATLNMPELQSFATTLAPGQKPFTSYYDVQRFIHDTVLPSIQAAVTNISAVDTSAGPLQLNFTPQRLKIDPVRQSTTYDEYSSYCTYDPSTGYQCQNYGYNYSYTDPKLPNVYYVDQYDIKVLRSSFLALEDQIIVGTAYSAENLEVATRQIKAVDDLRREAGLPGASAQDIVNVLANSQFGTLFTLEQDQGLGSISGSVAEALRNGIALANLKSQLCDSSSRNASNSLIHPICIEADVVDQLQVGLNVLAGPSLVNFGYDQNGNVVQIEMNLAAVLAKPPTDLKALLPTSFDSNGDPSNYKDPTMGGLFPKGDFISKLEEITAPRDYSKVAARAVRHAVRQVSPHL